MDIQPCAVKLTEDARWRVLKTLECQVNNHICYRGRLIADHDYRSRTHKDRFEFCCSQDGGNTWVALPLELHWKSVLTNALHGTWTPEKMDKLYPEGDYIVLEYRDPWIFFEKPFMPFGWDRESLWRAYFDPVKQHWRLVRVKKLYYGEGDPPPI